MLRGRPNVPEHVKLLRGTDQPCRRKSPPRNEKGAPPCPGWLSTEAKQEWRWIVKQIASELLQQVDRAILASYCDALGKIVVHERGLKEEGTTVETTNSRGHAIAIVNPRIKLIEQLWKRVEKSLSHLGFSPATRARLNVPVQEETPNPLREFLANRPN